MYKMKTKPVLYFKCANLDEMVPSGTDLRDGCKIFMIQMSKDFHQNCVAQAPDVGFVEKPLNRNSPFYHSYASKK